MRRNDILTVARWGLLAGATLFVGAYVTLALARMGYPFELDWIEDVMVTHVDRVLAGAPIYVAPSMDFVALLYTPLYYYVSAGVAAVTGSGFLPLRLVSFVASLGLFAAVYLIVRHETRDRFSGLVAVGLFAATFAIGGGWFDLARNDTTYLLFAMAGVFALQRYRGVRSAAAAGVLFSLAVMTKQSAVLVGAPLGLYLLVVDWRRGVTFGVTIAVLVGLPTLALDMASDGWYRYFTVEMPRHHELLEDRFVGFWTEDLVGRLPIATLAGFGCLAYRIVAPGRSWGFLLALSTGMLATAWSSRMHTGGFDNVLIPAFLAASILATVALHDVTGGGGGEPRPRPQWMALGAYGLAAVQFLLLVYNPAAYVPGRGDRLAGEAIVRELQEIDGEVWVPGQGYLAVMAGKPSLAHAAMIHDVLRAGESEAKEIMTRELLGSIARQRYAALLMDWSFPVECPERSPEIDGINWVCQEIHDAYRVDRDLPLGEDEFWPATGSPRRPLTFYVPRERQGATDPGTR